MIRNEEFEEVSRQRVAVDTHTHTDGWIAAAIVSVSGVTCGSCVCVCISLIQGFSGCVF